MDQDELNFDTRFSDSRHYGRPAAVIAAIVLVLGIILTMTTDLASRILPMDENYLNALVPRAPDKAEPLALKTLDQEISETVLTVRGTVENRTDFSISGLDAVIQPLDIYGIPMTPVDAAILPAEVQAHSTGTFQTTVTLNSRASGYSVKFRLFDGPFIPHKDERAPASDTGTK